MGQCDDGDEGSEGNNDDDSNNESDHSVTPANTKTKRHHRAKKEVMDATVVSLLWGCKHYTMLSHQALSKLCYKKLKPTIKKSWDVKIAWLKQEDTALQNLSGKALSKAVESHELVFRNNELKRLLSKQPDSVKKRVEEFWLKTTTANEGDADSKMA